MLYTDKEKYELLNPPSVEEPVDTNESTNPLLFEPEVLERSEV